MPSKRPLSIGISDFKTIITGNYAYVDKSLLIQEIVEASAPVILIPRMRRFGKTLNLSMLRYFFEKTDQDTSCLFKSLNIWENREYRTLQGQFPVIFISLKDVKHLSWEETLESFRQIIAAEFDRHQACLESEHLNEVEKSDYLAILHKKPSLPLLERSLFLLSKWLQRCYNRKAIILIDEYDTPAHAAYVGGFYSPLITFLRNWLSSCLKDNVHLERGVLTGILRIAKESIFSGLNNVDTFTVLNEPFRDKFGLLESEVKELLHEFGLSSKLPEFRQWYNGYRIGSCEGLYNPWSVLKCIEANGTLSSYWVNTSDNALMKQVITRGTDELKADVEELLRGGTVEKVIEEGIIFSNLDTSPRAVWALLLFSGYLTLAATPIHEAGPFCRLKIPNAEVAGLYHSMIREWFEKSFTETKYRLLLQSLTSGDIDTFSQLFQEFLLSATSVFDFNPQEPERVYHAFILGMLLGVSDRYEVRSNRESGYGRYDVMLIPKNPSDLGIIMEFKKIGQFEQSDLETAVKSALKQIEDKHYAQELVERGVRRILHLGLAFEGKRVLIRHKFK